ncbi:MAG TPA: hypothetical protein VFZ52_25215 [Chryseolinea sp.]
MLPKQLLTELLTSMEATFDEPGIKQFTFIHKDKFGEEYINIVADGTPRPAGLRAFVSYLEKNNNTFKFIKQYCEDNAYKDHQLVFAFYNNFKDVFEFAGEKVNLKRQFLDYFLLENESLPFIGRDNVKQSVETLLNAKRPKITVLKGRSRMGLSYTSQYLNEVANKTGQYELFRVDLRSIKNEYAPDDPKPQLLYASHVAAYIAGKLAIGFDVDPESKTLFKHSPFIGALKKYLEKEQKENNKTYLFFIDQLEAAPVNDVRNIILGIVGLSLEGSKCCYTVLSGLREEGILDGPIDTTTLRQLRSPLNTVPIDSFDEAQVTAYFKRIHKHLSDTYQFDETEETFLEKMNNLVVTPNDLVPPNVEIIGENVANWYEHFRTENSL